MRFTSCMVLMPKSLMVSKHGVRPTSDSVEYRGCCADTQVKESSKTIVRVILKNLCGIEWYIYAKYRKERG